MSCFGGMDGIPGTEWVWAECTPTCGFGALAAHQNQNGQNLWKVLEEQHQTPKNGERKREGTSDG